MLRVKDIVERCVIRVPIAPITIAAGQRVDVLPDTTGQINPGVGPFDYREEVAFIEIFNASAGNMYYNFGADADPNGDFCAYMQPGQMLEIKTRERVSVYNNGALAGKISMTVLIRKDLQFGQPLAGGGQL